MSLDAETLHRVALAAKQVPGPRDLYWPMPGNLGAVTAFSIYTEWQEFFLKLELSPQIPLIVSAKYDRALKLHLLAWIDFDIIKAGELTALTTLELALKDRYGRVVRRNRRGDFNFSELLHQMVKEDGLTDDKLPIQRRCGMGSIVKRLTGEVRPSYADLRNDLAHGYPFDGLPTAGLLEAVRDLIEYAYRDVTGRDPSRNAT